MNEQVLVYEIKSSAVQNAVNLFSNDQKYFYWNDSSFKFLNEGDYVFIVNVTSRWVLFTKFLEKRIQTEPDYGNLISRFNHNGKSFEPVAPSSAKLEEWNNFIHLEVLQKINLPKEWVWKSLGSSETTYLNGSRINKDAALNRMLNIEQLKMLSDDHQYQEVLNASLENFIGGTLNPIILKAIKTEKIQKIITDPDFYFQLAKNKLEEFENFPDLSQGDLDDLLADFSESDATYSDYIKKLDEKSTEYRLFFLIGELVSYCDFNAAGKKQLNQYEDNRVLAKSNVRQTDWVKSLLKYKVGGLNLEGIPDSIKNAISFLKNPDEGSTMLSEKHRERASKNLLGLDYNSTDFLNSVKIFFKPYNINCNNPLNYTLVLSKIFYDEEVKKLWDSDGKEEENQQDTDNMNFKEIINHVHNYIKSKGFKYEIEEVANFYLALKSKPFVILAGISGTGKTQLPRKFAEAVGMKKEEQVIQVPVRPDWTDSSDLIGYTALDGKFVPKPLIDAVLKAKNDKEKKPYFFILDEMNLARVEHYFSDFLSIIETRELKDGKIVTDVIIRDESFKTEDDKSKYGNLTWPENLFLIGTVNMDETTHAFSRKVLDRANSIEMNSINLKWIKPSELSIEPLKSISPKFFHTEFIESKQLTESDLESISKEMEILFAINDSLKRADLHFAYRVRDEVAFYLVLNKKYGLMDSDVALDFQLMQKVLPRIHGSSRRVYLALLGILEVLTKKEFNESEYEMATIKKMVEDTQKSKYQKSIDKILFMLERFDEDRFTSFWV
ncbi:McrB family protein [Algoriphagus sp. AK58]|uniref:McrB family protein n=1 Tax=Algoriphagus sp. AK58 TaxID=1406877 RepID=UPI00164F8979|nr:AAA family ATPase [Algoriphagus sp. AK58]MBC6368011.1 hypothetical protein [Algoriphagus sp. AK58]